MSTLLEKALQANIYLQPVHFVLGITTNTFSIWVFSSRALRSSSCTQYFLAYAIFSIMYISIACTTQLLHGFYIDWANSAVGCKINFYAIFLPPILATLMLVCASFDRYCSSSNSLLLRSRSTKRRAQIIIIATTILSSIYMIPTLIVYKFRETSKTCVSDIDIGAYTYILSQIFLYYIISPMLMMIFGTLTVYNIHHNANQIGIHGALGRGRRTEGQLTRMLILQISTHLILTVPFGIIYTMNVLESSTRTPNILAVRYLLVIWSQCDYSVSFFLYVLSGQVCRQQFIRILKYIKCQNTQVQPIQ